MTSLWWNRRSWSFNGKRSSKEMTLTWLLCTSFVRVILQAFVYHVFISLTSLCWHRWWRSSKGHSSFQGIWAWTATLLSVLCGWFISLLRIAFLDSVYIIIILNYQGAESFVCGWLNDYPSAAFYGIARQAYVTWLLTFASEQPKGSSKGLLATGKILAPNYTASVGIGASLWYFAQVKDAFFPVLSLTKESKWSELERFPWASIVFSCAKPALLSYGPELVQRSK